MAFFEKIRAPSSRISGCVLAILLRQQTRRTIPAIQARFKSKRSDLSSLVVPIPVKVSNNPDDINVGEELTGTTVKKGELLKILNDFFKRQPVRQLSKANGIDQQLFVQCFQSFRKYCLDSSVLPPELHIALSDIIRGHAHVDDLFRFFLKHAREVFPHLECIEELKEISDLTSPLNWYPTARNIERKIIFHSGPTNSGKTYHALQRFLNSESGIYCGPLKLLAVEVNTKANEAGTKCDLITGEERLYANENGTPSAHVACTVEMASIVTPCEVAVIDEIQMLRDPNRGWAWTRALLGVAAKEIHLCGEESAVDLVKDLLSPINEEVHVERYTRLTPLQIDQKALGSLDYVKPGDCIVCFSKNDIYSISLQLENKGFDVAVIYGGLPPGTKLLQTKKFNDPDDPCKYLVATDAIGMGLNLSIRRVIFYSLMRPDVNEKGEKGMSLISTSSALQIAGRAGRYNTQFDKGHVTTFKEEDLPVLKEILAKPVDPIKAAGLHPTPEQIELFAYHLPHATLSNLIDIFISLCRVDQSTYFMCNVGDFKYLAELIQHVPLPLRARYVFCCAPINRRMPLVCSMFLKFARQYSNNEPVTVEWLCRQINWPFSPPRNINELLYLEAAFDVLDLYLWLSYRFVDLFPDQHVIRDMQRETDAIIHLAVIKITKLLKNIPMTRERTQLLQNQGGNAKTKNKQTDKQELVQEPESDDLLANYKDLNPSENITEQLLKSGLLTPRMLDQLKQELLKNTDNDSKNEK